VHNTIQLVICARVVVLGNHLMLGLQDCIPHKRFLRVCWLCSSWPGLGQCFSQRCCCQCVTECTRESKYLTLTVAKPNTLMSSGFTVLMNVFLVRKEFFTSRSTVRDWLAYGIHQVHLCTSLSICSCRSC